ncbi:MAG: fused MFS/spermidine synthase [Deltaproteobacteria bacterium]|nr:fused MFS/spermidine synthase [Deltaproteobacteria bacterium]
MVARFAVTLFVSATLLFACQPMVARMIVPLLGGAPAVWILCSLCFQALVLGGYAYAHVVGSRLGLRAQIVLQLALVGSAFLLLPIAVDEQLLASLTAKSRSLGLLAVLLRSVGLPFFVLSTTSPLVQRWYSELGEQDPYHLYAASNAGSMLALLGYPLAVEPFLALHAQSRVLHAAYAVYAVLVVVCAATTLRLRRAVRIDATPAPAAVAAPESEKIIDGEAPARISKLLSRAPESRRERWIDRLVWIGLAFAPSSLLLGVTEFITTDIASVPLLWVVPLALYLASFIVVFAKRQIVSIETASRILAMLAAIVAISKLAEMNGPAWLIVGLHLALLFFASIVCHRALALRRPHHSRLTEFYLLLSLGGVLGGAFNGLVAPVVFDDLYEYPIAIGLGCLGRGAVGEGLGAERSWRLKRDVAYALILVLVTYVVAQVLERTRVHILVSIGVLALSPVIVAFMWRERPLRYATAIAGILLVGSVSGTMNGSTIHKERDFFGVLKVRHDQAHKFLLLQSGSTLHGAQSVDPALKRVPLTYYHSSGPCGDVLGQAHWAGPRRIGVIGLGVGALAAYAKPGDEWTFFELDPVDVAIAKKYFTFLSDVPEDVKMEIEEGDARLRVRDGAAGRFDVLVLDAFSSDAIPLHLVTREALAIYERALAPGGVLLAHISNRHVRLEPVFAKLAEDAGLLGISRRDDDLTRAQEEALISPSHWLVLTASSKALGDIGARNARWKPAVAPASQTVWTDDFANVLWAMRF